MDTMDNKRVKRIYFYKIVISAFWSFFFTFKDAGNTELSMFKNKVKSIKIAKTRKP